MLVIMYPPEFMLLFLNFRLGRVLHPNVRPGGQGFLTRSANAMTYRARRLLPIWQPGNAAFDKLPTRSNFKNIQPYGRTCPYSGLRRQQQHPNSD